MVFRLLHKENKKNAKNDTVFSMIMMLLVGVLFVMVLTMRLSGQQIELFGYSIYKVATDSMEPQLMVGDVILVKEVDAESLEVGDIVTYMSTTGVTKGLPVTHKLISEPYPEPNGDYLLYTCGIKEGAIMDAPFSAEYLIGKFIKKLTVLSFVYSVYETPLGLIIILLPIVSLIVIELKNVFKRTGSASEEKDNENEKQENKE